MSNPVLTALTTSELIRHVEMSVDATPRERELMERLLRALDEIDALAIDLKMLGDKRGDPRR